MSKIFPSAEAALNDIVFDGISIMVGCFGFCGLPETLTNQIDKLDTQNITLIAMDAGGDGFGLERLFEDHQVTKLITSYVGTNKTASQQMVAGTLEVDLRPQGTLIEAIRCGGAGIPAFFTRTGYKTIIAENKPHKIFDGLEYIEEKALVADIALIRAHKADLEGNLIYRKTARNSNPEMATAAKITIVEVDEIVPNGTLDPDFIHTPGIYVDRIIKSTCPKRVEHLSTRSRA